jgi:hypothetical protein
LLVYGRNRYLHALLGKPGWSSTQDINCCFFSLVSLRSTREKTYNFYHSRKITRYFPRTYVRTYYSLMEIICSAFKLSLKWIHFTFDTWIVQSYWTVLFECVLSCINIYSAYLKRKEQNICQGTVFNTNIYIIYFFISIFIILICVYLH